MWAEFVIQLRTTHKLVVSAVIATQAGNQRTTPVLIGCHQIEAPWALGCRRAGLQSPGTVRGTLIPPASLPLPFFLFPPSFLFPASSHPSPSLIFSSLLPFLPLLPPFQSPLSPSPRHSYFIFTTALVLFLHLHLFSCFCPSALQTVSSWRAGTIRECSTQGLP